MSLNAARTVVSASSTARKCGRTPTAAPASQGRRLLDRRQPTGRRRWQAPQAEPRSGSSMLERLAGGLWGSPAPQKEEAVQQPQDVAAVEDSVVEEVTAPTDVFGSPLPGDSEDVAPLRALLAQTRLEAVPLRLAYDADRDGWNGAAFHEQVDGCGPALVVALTVGGAIVGGYNPAGWLGQGGDRDGDSAFLYVWNDGDMSQKPTKLPKVGGAAQAVVRDEPGQGIWFGPDSLVIPLKPGSEKAAKGKLGATYSRKRDGGRHLFVEGAPVKGGARGTELVSLRVYVAE